MVFTVITKVKPQLRIDGAPYRANGSVKCWSCKAVQVNPEGMRGKNVKVHFAGQTIAANDYSNSMDVALIHYSTESDVLPVVQWLKVKDNSFVQEVNIPANHNRMIALVINRGPEAMKAEQAYACNVMPAKFAIGFSKATGTQIASNKTTVKKSKKSSSNSNSTKNIVEALVSSVQEVENAKATFDSSSGENSDSAAVTYDLASQKLAELEKNILASLKITITTDEGSAVIDFILSLADKPDEQAKYARLIAGIKAVLIFEKAQGNEKAGELLGKLSSGIIERGEQQ